MINRRSVIKTVAGGAIASIPLGAKAQETLLPPLVPSPAFGANVASADVSITVADSPLKQALDIYYDNLIGLVQGFGNNDKLLINNTITSFDISQDTPFFNEGLFRAFSDRVFRDSPENFTSGRADRFSLHYERIIRTAASKIDRNYDKVSREVDELQSKLEDQTNKLTNRVATINKQWNDLAKTMGITPADNDYELRYISYLEQVRYADQIDQYSQNIDMINGAIDAVRRAAYTEQQQLILDNLNELSKTKKVARPLRPQMERSGKNISEFTFADPNVKGAEGVLDVSPAMYPMGDLLKFLREKGEKRISIAKNSTTVRQHDSSWSAGGGGRFSFFGIGIGGSASGSGSSSYKQEINKSSSIEILFENLAEYYVDRGLWFDPSVFQNAELIKILSKIPNYDRLQYVSKSLIIARGLTLTFKFDEAVDATRWTKQAFAASGGVSIFGYRLGGSGGSNSYDYSVDISGDRKSITFKDDPQLARLLAVRLEPFAQIPKPAGGAIASVGGESPQSRLRKGTMDYLSYQKSKFGK